jgi:hypothetical protein
MASVMAIVGSALLVLTLVDSIGNLRGSDMRDSVEDFLAEPPGNGLGLETSQVLDALHVLGLVAGALAATAFVLAVFALQGHRGARVGLAVTTFLLILTMPVSGLMPVLLAVAVSLLWSRPARDWFDGVVPATGQLSSERDPRPGQGGPPAHTGSGGQPSQPPQPPVPPYSGGGQQGWQPKPASGWQPKPAAGWSPGTPPPYGTGYGQPGPQEHPGQQGQQGQQGQPGQPEPDPYAGPAYAPGWTGAEPGGHRDPDKRPGTVTAACVLTWIGAGLVAVAMLLAVLVLATSPADFTRELREGMAESEFVLTDDEVLTAGWAIVLTLLVWSLISLVLAVLTFRRSTVARIILVVSASMTVLVSLLGILSLISVIPLLMAGATVVLLFVGGANDWFARRRPAGAAGYDPYAPQYTGNGQEYGQYPSSSPYPPSGQYPPYGQYPTPGPLDPYSSPYGYSPQYPPQYDPRYDPQYPPPYGYGQQPGQQDWQQPQPQQDWHRDASRPTEPAPVSEGSSRDPQETTGPAGGEGHGREDTGPEAGPAEPEQQNEQNEPSSYPPPGPPAAPANAPPQEQQPRQPRRPW